MNDKNTAINEDFLKPYSPKDNEEALYKKWEESGYFNPDVCIEKGVTAPDAETFSIVLPPPNVTGVLHMGHAAMLATEDILVRYNRMQGKRTLWIPGTDSAAIATQSKVEGEIYKKEKKTRHDLGREELLRRVGEFAESSKDTIISQTKSMGSSLDWSRYAFTLDEQRYKAVMTAFVKMYEAGLIYRGARIVNWDPNLQTTVSDDEIEHVEQTDPFYYFKYGPFTIGTVRPETKFGDKYVVMHPDDVRYAEYKHGQQIEVEWINGPITATIIKDEAADREVGSGVMTITPWHSAVDFEIAERHGLDKEQVIDERGILLPIAGEFAGQHIKKARPAIVEKMKAQGLVEKIDEKYVHNVSTNSRGSGTIEPQIKEQWFVAVNKAVQFPDGRTMTLKERMRETVEGGEIAIAPERFNKIYYRWIDNLRDWCISRQIWYGHRVPAWFKDGEVKVQIESPGKGWEQDPDTLDTWFSSGLWTFSTLGWPEETDDFKTYHPTSVLETGYDIIFFWVARMILMSTFLIGQVPFKNVYLHGMVRDGKGQKMSKSKGNIINPLDMIEKYGADAIRLSLVVGAAPGNDVPLSEDKIRGYKNFANKLWNISRFVLSNTSDYDGAAKAPLSPRDQEILNQLYSSVAEVENDLKNFRLYLAAEKAYHYVWDELAAKVLEESKPILNGDDAKVKSTRQAVLRECLSVSLKLLHPFMPFVTEAVWQRLPEEMKETEFLMVAKWPAH
ncbi:MAG: valine--tRNA ligase [Candidatus Paceibacterota bacterium]